MWTERSAMEDDPLIHAMQIVLNYNDSISRYMQDMVTGNNNDIEEAQNELKLKLRNSASNRVMFYKTVNPYFIVHDIYTNSGGSRDKIGGGLDGKIHKVGKPMDSDDIFLCARYIGYSNFPKIC